MFTVSHIELTKSRAKANRAVLTNANGARWETFYASRGPALNRLDEGDRVTGTLWRGRLTQIAAAGASQETRAAPVDARERVLIGGLFCPGLVGDNGDRFWAVSAAWLAVAAVLTIVARLHVSRKHTSARAFSP